MTANTIDLRSDTVTRPTPAMREAMACAEVGDDVFGDDPNVNQLQELAATMLGKEAALFLPSGTQSNLCALMSHCARGDEYIVGQRAHTYAFEGGGAAVLGSIQPQPLDFEPDGTLDLAKVEAVIKPDDPHFARTRLLCLENTHNGKVLPLDYFRQAAEFSQRHGLILHLDGARVFNASVDLGVNIREITTHVDSVSVCLSKGLCAPVGSVLCGSSELIASARRWRKVLGGGMRQAGILAAAGALALTEQVEHLATDHENARILAATLADTGGLQIDAADVHTNMIFARVTDMPLPELVDRMRETGILLYGSGDTLRLVTHFDFDRQDIKKINNAFSAALQ